MTHEPHKTPNAEQIRFWNEMAGPRWIAERDIISHNFRGLSAAVLDRAAIPPGGRVLDVGCGGGETTIEIARRVGPRGAVTGVDVSLPMVTYALEAARAAGAANASFALADAQTAALPEGAFDLLFSRFGVMFFSDPEAAFRNLRRALRPGGRMTFLCWRALEENPMMHVPGMAVATVAPLVPFLPDAPGPFAFADAERVRGILERAGFSEVAFEKLDLTIPVGPISASPADGAAFLVQMGPAGAAIRAAGPEVVPAATAAVREALAPYHKGDCLWMPSATWIVTGLTPGAP